MEMGAIFSDTLSIRCPIIRLSNGRSAKSLPQTNHGDAGKRETSFSRNEEALQSTWFEPSGEDRDAFGSRQRSESLKLDPFVRTLEPLSCLKSPPTGREIVCTRRKQLREQRFKPANRCIYCDAQKAKLTDEHIVPYSLGGTIVLPKASCTACQKLINDFETPIATQAYISFRSAQRFPSRTQSLLSHIPVEFEVGPLRIKRPIPIDDAPVPAIIPSFGLPPYMPGGGEATPAKLNVLPIDDKRWVRTFRHCKEASDATITSDGIRVEEFARLLTKISYGFAWLADPVCAFNWEGRARIFNAQFPDFPVFPDLFSVPQDRDRDEAVQATLFTNTVGRITTLFCQLEILAGVRVPSYICQIGPTRLQHPFGLTFSSTRDIDDLGGMQLRLPVGAHLQY